MAQSSRPRHPARSLPLRRAVATLLAAIATLVAPAAASAESYPYDVTSGSYGAVYPVPHSLSFSNTDDGTASVALPFAFQLFGHAYPAGHSVTVSTNGVIEFGDNLAAYTDTALPSATFTGPAIMPFWTDFDVTLTTTYSPTGDGEGVAWGVSGTAPNRTFTVLWSGYVHGSSPLSRITFYANLHETTNAVDFTYLRAFTDPIASGVTATIGMQASGGGEWQQISHDTAVISQSAAYYALAPALPASTASPVISGSVLLGQQLSVSTGAWDGAPHAYGYQWERCPTAGCGTWTDIPGATASTYTLQAADVGKYVFAAVHATNGWGTSGWRFAYFVGPVLSEAVPTIITKPALSGTAQVGATVTTTHGTWTGSPTSYTYEWWRCLPIGGGACAPSKIAAATTASYTLTSAELGGTVYVAVTAHNGGGDSVPSVAPSLGPVTGIPVPTVVTVPAISGGSVVGSTLTATSGTWTGSPDAYAYSWQRCAPSGGGGCVPAAIAGATATSYVTTIADLGTKVYVLVTAHNAGGNSSPSASASISVTAAPTPTPTPTPLPAPGATPTPTTVPGPTAAPGADEGQQAPQDEERSEPPAITFGAKRTVTRTGSKVVVHPGITVSCPDDPGTGCAVTLAATARLTVNGRRTTVSIARSSSTIPVGWSRALVFTLNAKGVAALRRRSRLPVTVAVRATSATGLVATKTTTFDVRRPKGLR